MASVVYCQVGFALGLAEVSGCGFCWTLVSRTVAQLFVRPDLGARVGRALSGAMPTVSNSL